MLTQGNQWNLFIAAYTANYIIRNPLMSSHTRKQKAAYLHRERPPTTDPLYASDPLSKTRLCDRAHKGVKLVGARRKLERVNKH